MQLMKTIKLLALSIVLVSLGSCSSNDDDDQQPSAQIETQTITNLHAPQESDFTTNPPTVTGDYVKFSFTTGGTVTGDNWDIAFRGTTILINGGEATADDQPNRTGNGGAYTNVETTFNEVTEVNPSLFNEDTITGGLAINSWYDYNPTTHMITPTAGKILVIKTHDGKYAKIEILSYYENSQPNAEADNFQYYTFKYAYQPNEGETSF